MVLRRYSKKIAYILVMVMLLGGFAFPVQSQAEAKKYDKIHIAEKKIWYFDYLDVPETWDFIDAYKKAHPKKTFKKVKVAVIDSGAELTHKDLQANLDKAHSVDVTKKDYPKYTQPASSHGTQTVGIVGATSKNKLGGAGIAAGNKNNLIKLMAIKVFRDDAGTASQAKVTTSDLIKGLDYAYKQGAQVISMCCGHKPDSKDAFGKKHDDAALERKINELVGKGVVVVCSAGNRGSDRIWYPSDFDAVISVIASKQYSDIDQICKVKTSSYGPKKDIMAPGSNILTTTTNNRYYEFGKTSSAVSIVCGVVAMMLYVNPNLTVDQVKSILYRTATDTFTPGFDIYSGYGNVNAYAAVTAAAGEEKYIVPKMAKAPQMTASSESSSAIKLTWNKVSRATNYEIYQQRPFTKQYNLIATTTDTSYVLGGLTFNANYNFAIAVKATSTDGKRIDSDISSPVAVRPTTGSATLTVKKLKDDKTKVTISWSAAASADGYVVSTSKSSDGTYRNVKNPKTGDAGSIVVKAPNGEKKSYYRITPYKLDKNGERVYGPVTNTSK